MASIKLTYIGHASFRFESEAGTIVYFDPWLDENPVAKLKRDEVTKADIVVSTHGHNDHCRDAFEICRRTKATFVSGYEMSLVAQAHGMELGEEALPLNPGGSVKVKDVAITLTQAQHGSQSMSPDLVYGPPAEGEYFRAGGCTSGAVLSFDNGVAVYDTSDTCLFSDMQLIGEMYCPQIAIVPVGGMFTMGIREAARAASIIRPDIVMPCHHGEAVGQPADINEFTHAVRFLSPNVKVAAIEPGQTLKYTASSYTITDDETEK